MKVIVFDMDGTIADLYGYPNWLKALRNEDETPYSGCKPLVDMRELYKVLMALKKVGYRIVVTSWLSKDSSKEYKSKVRKAKKDWLITRGFPYDEVHLVQYGTTKADCTRKLGGFQILVDDNEKVLKGWHLGATINAKSDIIKALYRLLKSEY